MFPTPGTSFDRLVLDTFPFMHIALRIPSHFGSFAGSFVVLVSWQWRIRETLEHNDFVFLFRPRALVAVHC